MSFLEIFKYSFMQNALIVGLLSSICCGIIGTYIVNKKMVFISSSISHASYGGIGIGIFLIYSFKLEIKDPLIFGLIFSIFSGILILVLKDFFNVDSDLGIGIMMSLGMAVGIIFSFMTPGYQADMSTYLFGNILLSNKLNIVSRLVLNSVTIVFFIVFYKGIVTFINYFMIILVSSAIIINIKTIGIILIISILTIPQATASIIAKKYSVILFLSVFFSFLGILFGLYFSYIFNIPSGPSIIVSLTILLVIVKVFSFFAKKY